MKFKNKYLIAGLLIIALALSLVSVMAATLPMVDDFEHATLPTGVDSAGGAAIGWAPFSDAPLPTLSLQTVLTSTALARPGQGASNTILQVDFTNVGNYRGFTHAFENPAADLWVSQDWSNPSYTGISFWLKGANTGGNIQFEIFDTRSTVPGDSAERWVMQVPDNAGTGWRQVFLPFSSFTPGAYQPAGNDGIFQRTAVWGWTMNLPASNATIYVDDVSLYPVTIDAPIIPLNSATVSGPATGMVNTLYNYSVITDPISATTPISYSWSPMPNSGQGTPNVTYQWANLGLQTIVVTASNISSTVNGFYSVTIDAPIIPLNSATVSGPTAGMVNTLYNYSVITSPISATQPISYSWSPTPNSGDGTPNVTYQWANIGVYPISVTVSNLTGTVVGTYMVNVAGIITPTSINVTGPITGLANTTYPFSATINPISATMPITYTWTPAPTSGQGSAAVTYLWAMTGTQNITVVAQNAGGMVSNGHTITLNEASIIGLSATNNGPTSRGSATTLQATVTSGSNIAYSWNFGDGTTGSGVTVNHTYTAIGSYTAIVTASNSANVVTTTTVVTVLPAAITGLAASNNGPTALGGATTLNATVTAGDNVSYSWDFGDGTTGSGAAVNHTYALGSYNATVTASNSQGSATASTTVIVTNASITGLSATNNSPTTFGNATTLNATITSGSNVVYNWSFGNGLTATGASVNHAYTTIGTYTAIVTASNTTGAVAANTTVVIQAAPISDTLIVGLTAINDSPKVVNSPVALSALVSAGSGISYTWTFGDGTTGSGATVNHAYANSGKFTATVTARNSLNTLVATVLVTILDTPIAGLTASNNGPTALGDVTMLNASVTAGDGVTYRWDFGDGSSGNGAVVSHTYSALGSYTAIVSATNTSGSQTATTVVSVISPVSLSLSKRAPVSVQQGNPIEYTLTVVNNGLKSATNLTISDPMPLGATYLNGGTLNGNTVNWTMAELPAKGSAIVTFTVMASDTVINENYSVVASGGYSATGQAVTVTIIKPNPISGLVVMSDSPTLFGGMTHFTATTQSGDNVAYQWDFGDGATASGLAVQHSYAVTGSYTVTVVASNAVSMVTATTIVQVITPPISNEGFIAGTVTVANNGQPLSGIYVVRYQWTGSWWNWVDYTQANVSGYYEFNNIAANDHYAICAYDWQFWPQRYLSQCYDNATEVNQATHIALSGGQSRVINFAMLTPGRITGVIRDPNGQPLSNMYIEVLLLTSNTSGTTESAWTSAGGAQSNADGSYQVSGLATGQYWVKVSDWRWPNREYATKYYPNAMTPTQETLVNVTLGQTTPNIDVTMSQPGQIKGKVTNKQGQPAPNIYVTIYRLEGTWWQWAGQAQTDNQGEYTVKGLNGTYRVSFFDWNWPRQYIDMYYPSANSLEAGTDIQVVPEQIQTVDVSLKETAKIIGRVTDYEGHGVSSAFIKVFRQEGTTWQQVGWGTWTNEGGHYKVTDLPEGTYRVGFYAPPWGFSLYGFYNQANTLDEATNVVLDSRAATTGINFQLPKPVPPVAEVKVADDHGSYVDIDPRTGEVTIGQSQVDFYQHDIKIDKTVTCDDGTIPSQVTLLLETIKSYPMTESSPGSGKFSATILKADILNTSGTFEIKISKVCSGIAKEITIGKLLLYDPAGLISDMVTNNPIPNAIVTLYNVPGWRAKQGAEDNTPNTCESHLSKDATAAWSQMAPITQGVMALVESGTFTPAVNPLITNGVGRYKWDVAEGCWYVTVQADGYETKVSPVVGVPPEVTDLNVALKPLPMFRFTTFSYEANRANTTAVVTVTSGMAVTTSSTVDYIITTEDGTAILTGTLTFAPGQSQQALTLNLSQLSGGSQFNLTLTQSSGTALGLNTEAVLSVTEKALKTQYLPIIVK